MMVRDGFGAGRVGWPGVGSVLFSLIFLRKLLVIEHSFEYNGSMQLGDATTAERDQCTPIDLALDAFENELAELIIAVESGGLEQLPATDKVAVWQRFETLRNTLPVVDHGLIADAEASDLAHEYCSSTLAQFLIRVLQLSPGEAAARVRAAAALAPRTSMLGAQLEPQLPWLAALQRDGAVTVEKVAILERAMHKLSRPNLDPEAVHTAEQLLAEHAPILGPAELRRFARAVVNAAELDGPEPIDDALQQDRRYLELKQRRDGMWHLRGRLTATLGTQLNSILEPLAKPRSSSNDNPDGTTTKLADQRPSMQRLHDALDEACGKLLKSCDLPSVGGMPASIVVTITLDDLLAKAGVAETADGTQLSADQLWRLVDEAEIWPIITSRHGVPLALGRSQRLASKGQTLALIARDGGCSFPGCTHPPAWCDRHHILDWISGGETDLNNLTLLCRYHHTHFLQKGWTCHINDHGLPEWIPPRWIDRDQRPHINDRIKRIHIQQLNRSNRQRTPAAA